MRLDVQLQNIIDQLLSHLYPHNLSDAEKWVVGQAVRSAALAVVRNRSARELRIAEAVISAAALAAIKAAQPPAPLGTDGDPNIHRAMGAQKDACVVAIRGLTSAAIIASIDAAGANE